MNITELTEQAAMMEKIIMYHSRVLRERRPIQDVPEAAPILNALSITGQPIPDPLYWTTLAGPTVNENTAGVYADVTRSLWIANPCTDEGLCSGLHEIGHAFWHKARTTWQEDNDSTIGSAIDAVLYAVDYQTDLVNRAVAAATKMGVEYVMELASGDSYGMNPNEVWARAFSQYIVTRPDQKPEYRASWEPYISLTSDLRDMHWSTDEFKPVAKVFQEHGF